MRNNKTIKNIANWAKAPLRKSQKLLGSKTHSAQCNLCGGSYSSDSKFTRFCNDCRSESETYRLAEWLPHVGVGGFAS